MAEEREEGKKTQLWDEPEKRLRFLVSLLIALTVLFVLLAANSPEGSTMMAKLRAYRQSMENHRRFQQALALDPPLGAKKFVGKVYRARTLSRADFSFFRQLRTEPAPYTSHQKTLDFSLTASKNKPYWKQRCKKGFEV